MCPSCSLFPFIPSGLLLSRCSRLSTQAQLPTQTIWKRKQQTICKLFPSCASSDPKVTGKGWRGQGTEGVSGNVPSQQQLSQGRVALLVPWSWAGRSQGDTGQLLPLSFHPGFLTPWEQPVTPAPKWGNRLLVTSSERSQDVFASSRSHGAEFPVELSPEHWGSFQAMKCAGLCRTFCHPWWHLGARWAVLPAAGTSGVLEGGR